MAGSKEWQLGLRRRSSVGSILSTKGEQYGHYYKLACLFLIARIITRQCPVSDLTHLKQVSFPDLLPVARALDGSLLPGPAPHSEGEERLSGLHAFLQFGNQTLLRKACKFCRCQQVHEVLAATQLFTTLLIPLLRRWNIKG